MSYVKFDLRINKDTKQYRGWYCNKIGDKYYIFRPDKAMIYTRFTLKDCKSCINQITGGQ